MSDQQMNLFDPMSSAADSPAKTCQWLESVLGFLESEAGCGSSSAGLSPSLFPVGFLLRTSLGCCRATKAETWEPSFGRWGNSGMGTPTGCLTLNTSEWPSDGGVCSLSDVLEMCDVPQKFFLSAKACRGILRRAGNRGRELPTQLQRALEPKTSATNYARCRSLDHYQRSQA